MKKKKKQVSPVLIILGLIVLVLAFLVGPKLIDRYTPTKERLELTKYYSMTEDSQVAITLNHTVLENYATMIDGNIYVDYKFVHDILNSRFYWDANESILLYTTASDIITIKPEETTYMVGKSSTEYGRPLVYLNAGSAWVDLDFVNSYSDFTYSYFDSPHRIVINNDWTEITVAKSKRDTEVRLKGGIKSPILCDVKNGTELTVLDIDEKWTKVCTEDGITGYIRSNYLSKTTTKTLESTFVPETFSHIVKNEKISLLWHPVYSSAANANVSTVLSETKGVNVISPTWFRIADNNGNISSMASTDYVNYCHERGIEVWGLVSNLEVQGVDSAHVLTHTSLRQKMVNQLVAYALQYNLDGINVDFEQLSESEVGDGYIQFLRELSVKCENNDIILSTSVYTPAPYNDVYRYGEQSNFVDYIALMAYDQHYGQSSGEGSVASLDWVEEGINNTLDEGVPAEQILLGIPFYSRLWKLTPNEDGSFSISEEEYGLSASSVWMSDNVGNPQWLDDCGQWYGEKTTNGITYKMWLENKDSLDLRMQLMENHNLAGAAFWSSALDNAEAWDVIIRYIN